MRLGLITGNHPRHLAFCNHVAATKWPDCHVLVEREEFIPNPPPDLNKTDTANWRTHFGSRAKAEKKWFKEHQALKFQTDTLKVLPKQLNSDKVVQWLKEKELDVVLILGVPIIKEPLFSTLPDWKINLHMGLIPEYKGSITFFWPFYFLRPQEAGCTYHVIDKRVDTGQILHQVLPILEFDMGMHDAACSALLTAYGDVRLVLRHAEQAIESNTKPTPDPTLLGRGKLFKSSDWHAGMLEHNYGYYGDRMINAYLMGKLPGERQLLITRLTHYGTIFETNVLSQVYDPSFVRR